MLSQQDIALAQLLVRELDDDVKARLQQRAARHGRSMEAEVRDILRAAVIGDPAQIGLGSEIAAMFGDFGLPDGADWPELRGHGIEDPFA